MVRNGVEVLLLVKAEDDGRSLYEDRPLDQVGIPHHQVQCFLLGSRQRALLEDRTASAHEIEKVLGVDVLLEEFAGRRLAIDIDLANLNTGCGQKTSGVPARRSGGLQVEDGWAHFNRLQAPEFGFGFQVSGPRPVPVRCQNFHHGLLG